MSFAFSTMDTTGPSSGDSDKLSNVAYASAPHFTTAPSLLNKWHASIWKPLRCIRTPKASPTVWQSDARTATVVRMPPGNVHFASKALGAAAVLMAVSAAAAFSATDSVAAAATTAAAAAAASVAVPLPLPLVAAAFDAAAGSTPPTIVGGSGARFRRSSVVRRDKDDVSADGVEGCSTLISVMLMLARRRVILEGAPCACG